MAHSLSQSEEAASMQQMLQQLLQQQQQQQQHQEEVQTEVGLPLWRAAKAEGAAAAAGAGATRAARAATRAARAATAAVPMRSRARIYDTIKTCHRTMQIVNLLVPPYLRQRLPGGTRENMKKRVRGNTLLPSPLRPSPKSLIGPYGALLQVKARQFAVHHRIAMLLILLTTNPLTTRTLREAAVCVSVCNATSFPQNILVPPVRSSELTTSSEASDNEAKRPSGQGRAVRVQGQIHAKGLSTGDVEHRSGRIQATGNTRVKPT
ncbi:uncharacterized protein LOC118647743 [Monomorium pharaonis]|uniref:uncharacterized protein LOC118647743 n=1 Tax=Monomorium pharaonis TaxID=307658 RepID=UPI001745DFA6|nr:uncharacterized protein LOC118647743 [Monomorium pharaonis]